MELKKKKKKPAKCEAAIFFQFCLWLVKKIARGSLTNHEAT